jgi:hypothetical protein
VNQLTAIRVTSWLAALLLASPGMFAQQGAPQISQETSTVAVSAVPRMVSYSGVLRDASSRAITGVTGVTFLIYKDETGGAPLWLETQSVKTDASGHYAVQLGAASAHGLSAEMFITGEGRWLGVQIGNQPEQPRVLLVAVPYAMKAADAETIGGLPPSAFVLAAPPVAGTATQSNDAAALSPSAPPPPASPVTTTGGTANTVPLFTTGTNIQNSILTQTGTSAINVGGKLNLPATGTATASAGKNSQPEVLVASSFNSGASAAVAQKFELQAEPANNNKTTASGTLNLLYGSGTAAPAETGLKINNKGQITFASGQTFPGTGSGTVKSVGLSAPSSDFTASGSPVTGTGTLKFVWQVAPTNADTANAIVKRDASGNFSAGVIGAKSVNVANFVSIPSAGSIAISASSGSTSASTIFTEATATTGSTSAIEAITQSSASNAYGVWGLASASTGDAVGVFGIASSTKGIGVFGRNGTLTSVGVARTGAQGVGIWGDAGTGAGINKGVQGTADNGTAGYFENSGGSYFALFSQADTANGYPFKAFNSANGTYCYVDPTGSFYCSGSKNALVPVDNNQRYVSMSAIESPQNWFEDAGSGQLVNGVAVVKLDPDFIQTVNTGMDYKVFPVPNGDCKGLYVTRKTATSFEVRELGGGKSSVSFDYRIMALRKKYENVRFADHTKDLEVMKRSH